MPMTNAATNPTHVSTANHDAPNQSPKPTCAALQVFLRLWRAFGWNRLAGSRVRPAVSEAQGNGNQIAARAWR